MSLRNHDGHVDVICDACGAVFHSANTNPVYAANEVEARHGWTGGGALRGLRCPDCKGLPMDESLPHFAWTAGGAR